MAIKKSGATWVEREHPSATGLKVALGFKADEPDQDESGDTAESIDLPGDLEKEPTIHMVDLSFKLEDIVETTRRFTIKVPISELQSS